MGHGGKPIPNAGSGGDAVVNRIAVGAHYGLKDWLVQRVSAVVMAVYSVGFALCVLPRMPYGFDSWRALFAPAWSKIAALLFIAALLVHAWIGVRDIFMDYIKPKFSEICSRFTITIECFPNLLFWNVVFDVFPSIFWSHIIIVFGKCFCVETSHLLGI